MESNPFALPMKTVSEVSRASSCPGPHTRACHSHTPCSLCVCRVCSGTRSGPQVCRVSELPLERCDHGARPLPSPPRRAVTSQCERLSQRSRDGGECNGPGRVPQEQERERGDGRPVRRAGRHRILPPSAPLLALDSHRYVMPPPLRASLCSPHLMHPLSASVDGKELTDQPWKLFAAGNFTKGSSPLSRTRTRATAPPHTHIS
jgi:hypothetical protein